MQIGIAPVLARPPGQLDRLVEEREPALGIIGTTMGIGQQREVIGVTQPPTGGVDVGEAALDLGDAVYRPSECGLRPNRG